MQLAPLLPPQAGPKQYTLVLDLDETLVHFDARRQLLKVRPYCDEFLSRLALKFEVVVFTAAQ